MSLKRPIWNDGQGLATPDLQRVNDIAGSADDRVFETVFTPGSVQKKILPLLEETASFNPRLLAIPSPITTGAVRMNACTLIAGDVSLATQIDLSASTISLDGTAITSNASGSIRYDLIYATVQRSVTLTGSRKIKSATDGTLSNQTVNLQDTSAVTLGIVAGFLTGATAPTLAQINAAVPADTAPGSTTFGVFNFPICYVQVANGYSSGTALQQFSSGGATYIVQAWNSGWIQYQRIKTYRFPSLYSSVLNEKPTTQITDRIGDGVQLFAHFKVLTTTPTTSGTAFIIDNTIDWRHRLIYGFGGYFGSANSPSLPLETANTPITVVATSTTTIAPLFTANGSMAANDAITWSSGAATLAIGVDTSGRLAAFKGGTAPIDAANGDLIIISIFASPQIVSNI